MLVDEGLNSPQITFNAGTHTEAITMSLGDYLELTKPNRGDLGRWGPDSRFRPGDPEATNPHHEVKR